MTNHGYQKLEVEQRSIDWTVDVYGDVATFPREERFGLSQQIQRAAVSVASNISEGRSREGPKEFLHFLSISKGSLSEVRTQLEIAWRLGYLPEERLTALLDEATIIVKQINSLRAVLKRRLQDGKKGKIDKTDLDDADEEELGVGILA